MLYSKEKIEKLQHRWTTNKGKQLLKSIIKNKLFLNPALFRQKIHNFHGINDEEVINSIDMRGAPLHGIDFRLSIQENEDGFHEDLALLSNIHFEGAILKHCNFQDGKIYDCNFEQTDLSHANFANTNINNCRFNESDCTTINLRGTKLSNCNFTNAIIKDSNLNATIVDEKTTFGKKIISEQNKNFHFASIEYKQIKEMYKNSSLHGIADKYHYKEMVAKRKINKKRNPKRLLNFLFGDLLCKYGTSFIRVFISSGILILLCAIYYKTSNEILFQNNITIPSLLDSLYFSIVTFTTLGYGDYHAIGATRFIAAAESFLGSTLLSLFTVIVARNIIRD